MRDTEPYDRELYERMGFERVRRRVASVAPAGKELVFDDGSRLSYDKLLLAVGSKGRPAPWPGADGPGVHCFVTLRDLEGLDRDARPGGRAVVIGGGLIGVEAAEILHHRGLHVTFVVRENWYFPLALDEKEAALVTEHMRQQGIDVRFGVNVKAVVRGEGGGPRAVRLEAGDEVACDVVVSAIGVVPNTSVSRGLGHRALQGRGHRGGRQPQGQPAGCLRGGRLRQRDLGRRVASPGAALVHGPRPGPARGPGHAGRRGRLPARHLVQLGEVLRHRVDHGGLGARPAQLGQHALGPRPRREELVPARCPASFVSQRIVVKGDRVVGFNMLGSRWNHEPLLQWIHERRSLDYVLEHLPEAQFDEEFMPRFRVLSDVQAR